MLVQKGVSPLSSMYLFENHFFENTPPKSSGKTLPKKPYENGKITIQTLVDIGESRAEGKRVCLYSYYNSDGEPIYLLRGDINANGYDSDGDRVSMDIHIDYFGNVSGNYECSGWFSDYKLSGKRGSDGVLRITGENTWGRDDATFVLSASYNGEIEGYCDNGSRKYEITLSY